MIVHLPFATSPISAAMVAVIVRTGANRLPSPVGITAALPVTIITTIVSPIVRPTPSMIAISTPERAAGRVTFQIVCQPVAPIARAASR